MSDKLSDIIRKTRRAVVKIGSSVLVENAENGRFSFKVLQGMTNVIADQHRKGLHTVIVSSGAIALGMAHLKLAKKPKEIGELQACAAIGQPLLMQMYQKAFAKKKLHTAQILLTRDDFEDPARCLNAKHTLQELLKRDVIPIINENDTTIVDEIRVGDNDNLAALVTNMINANLLILLTDQDAFYTADPRNDPKAVRIPVVENIDDQTFARAANTQKSTSVGGMLTKLEAAKKTAEFGIPTIIASGKTAKPLQQIFKAESVGTLFLPKASVSV